MVTIKEPKKFVLVGTAGHIDHGKTELVRSFTGCDTDRLPEEKNRGMSIDLGFASCLLKGNTLAGIVDVPGHEKFIRNMVAGVAAIDAIVLVVAADDGVMPQTQEHVNILELLGISKGIVAITKIDMVEPDMVDLVLEDVHQFLQGTFLADAPTIPLSPISGEGMREFWDTLNTMVASIEPRDARGLFRMPVERKFSLKGLGSVATGMPLTGRVQVNDLVEILPSGKLTRVRGLQVYKKKARRAVAGECVALNVPELSYDEINRGDVLAVPGHFQAVSMVDTKVEILKTSRHPLKDHAPVRFHIGTAEVMGRAALLDRRVLSAGEQGFVQFRLDAPVVIDPGDRFIVRLQSPAVTVGGGMVLREQHTKLRRFRSYVIDDLKEHEKAVQSEKDRVVFAMRKTGLAPLRPKEIVKLSKVPLETVNAVLAALGEKEEVFEIATFGFVHIAAIEEAAVGVLEILSRFHGENPLREGLGPLDVRRETNLDKNASEFLLTRMEKEGRIRAVGPVLAHADFHVDMSEAEGRDLSRVEEAFRGAAFHPPDAADLTTQLDISSDRAEVFINLLADRGSIVGVAENLWFHADTLAEARRCLVEYLQENGEIGAVSYRKLIDTSRKFAYPLLDYFDVLGVTLRKGNLRYLKGRIRGEE